MLKRLVVLLAVVVGGRETVLLDGGARLDRAQIDGLCRRYLCGRGRGRCGVGNRLCLGLCRLGLLGLAGARQFVRCLGNLGFEIFHGSRNIEVAGFHRAQIDIECRFEFLGNFLVEGLCRGGFLRHAFATLY